MFRRNREREEEQQPTYLILSSRPFYTSLMKIALLGHALGVFPLPYPVTGKTARELSRIRRTMFRIGSTWLYTYAYYGPSSTAVTQILSKPLIRIASTAYMSSFLNTVLKASSELRDLSSKVLVVFAQAPLDGSYVREVRVGSTSGMFLPTPKVLDRCNVFGSDGTCYEENLNGLERLAIAVDSGLIMSLLYIFIDSSSSGLQLKLYMEQAGNVEGKQAM